MDDLDRLERRIDALEARNEAEDALAKAKADRNTAKHTGWQLGLAIISTVTMLVNLYLSLNPHK